MSLPILDPSMITVQPSPTPILHPTGPGPSDQPLDPNVAPFTLNKTKQIQRLVNDASRENDIEFECNNSNTNINIKCSPGFYAAVAKPSLSGLSLGFTHTHKNVLMSLTDILPSLDQNSTEYVRLLRISLASSVPGSEMHDLRCMI